MEEDLQKSEERFRALIESSSDVTTILDAVAHNHLENPANRGIVVNFRDITERKQAGMSHQLLQKNWLLTGMIPVTGYLMKNSRKGNSR